MLFRVVASVGVMSAGSYVISGSIWDTHVVVGWMLSVLCDAGCTLFEAVKRERSAAK